MSFVTDSEAPGYSQPTLAGRRIGAIPEDVKRTRLAAKLPRQFAARHRDLLSGSEVLQREGVGLHFVFANNKDVARAHLVGGLERLFQAEGLVAEIDDEVFIIAAKFAGETGGFAIHPRAERGDVDVGLAQDGFGGRGE